MTRILNKVNIKEIEEDYAPVFDIMSGDEENIYKLKCIISRLDETDKRIILLYTELQSQRKVAKLLGISTSLCNIKINEIRKKIYDEYYN